MRFFHTMEKSFAVFPRYGKKFSTLWKTSLVEPRRPRRGAVRLFPWTWDMGHGIWEIASHSRLPFRSHFIIPLSALILLAALAPQARAQLGPYPIRTKQAEFEATLVKRERDTLWIERRSADGGRAPQVGIPVADILAIAMPRPALFAAVEKIRSAPAATDAQFAAAHAALDKFILQTKALRDLPGIPANEAMLLKGKLFSKKTLWREAIRQYEDLVTKAAGTAVATNAQLLAGIAYSRSGEHQFAVEYLGGMPLPEEDEELLSDLLFALGNSYFALGNYDNALLSYLPLVVFYPYVYGNEARGLAAALACYAELKEWEPLYRTVQEIKTGYPGSPAEQVADKFLADYQAELQEAGQFVDAAKITSADGAAAGGAAPTNAPAASTNPPAPADVKP